jgi:hypothetical protein
VLLDTYSTAFLKAVLDMADEVAPVKRKKQKKQDKPK